MGRHLSIRDLQKISGKAIEQLPGTTAITSDGRTIALLTPLKKTNPESLRAWAEQVEALARERDPDEDTRFLIENGADPTPWTDELIRQVQEEHLALVRRTK
jgi:antitoxin (DNA-binding transcriptional repressor) of toxin-antitoxin stability system